MDSGNEETRASRLPFEHFDVVPEAKDHCYISDAVKQRFSNGKSPNYAKIMKEWKILKKNLPENIYVQVYETRIDLLRAVIIGASGTPYHDGLFFFDIFLPSSYPERPPLVHYHAHGYRLNPNLYSSGYVCLSLINTWQGGRNERWTTSSSILQVLVSIQGLVLNEKPFFNEPGTSFMHSNKEYLFGWLKTFWYEYNEDVFILSCKTMLHSMKNPPKNFENFVAQHFRLRAVSILTAILDYRKGKLFVGQMNGPSSGVKVSNSFRKNLMKMYSELKTAFSSLISEADMKRIENMENEESEELSPSLKKGNAMSERKKIFARIVGCFGL